MTMPRSLHPGDDNAPSWREIERPRTRASDRISSIQDQIDEAEPSLPVHAVWGEAWSMRETPPQFAPPRNVSDSSIGREDGSRLLRREPRTFLDWFNLVLSAVIVASGWLCLVVSSVAWVMDRDPRSSRGIVLGLVLLAFGISSAIAQSEQRFTRVLVRELGKRIRRDG